MKLATLAEATIKGKWTHRAPIHTFLIEKSFSDLNTIDFDSDDSDEQIEKSVGMKAINAYAKQKIGKDHERIMVGEVGTKKIEITFEEL